MGFIFVQYSILLFGLRYDNIIHVRKRDTDAKVKGAQKNLKKNSKKSLTNETNCDILKSSRGRTPNKPERIDTMTKMTYAMALDVAINAVADDAVVEKLTALKAQIEKKNSAERKPTKAQVANDALKGEMLSFLVDAHTATEVAENFGISNQKASALLTALVKGGAVERTVDKRKAYFKVA
jgi:sugar-specific transcriptional regulator TrmB